MKILAVIPAKKDSEIIPNKNVRILNGRPLIYYAIRNAQTSKIITNIVVTTDSADIKNIALQMGVGVKIRDSRLCADDVTLSPVVYDAIPTGVEWDYIITLDPTSPLLKVSTLDNAIEYAIKNKCETVISVINNPQITWRKENGINIPNCDNRVNRRFMEPSYVEKGAFTISKRNVVTSQTRLGKNIELYEIDSEEAIEIKTFDDLKLASFHMEKQKVAFYVNGNNTRGTGHIYRVLELADEFYAKPDIYYDINQTDVSIFGETNHQLKPVNGIADLFEKCRENQYTIFINDILTTTLDYMIGLRTVLRDAKIINFEDDGEGAIKADLVFNALYGKSDLPNTYSGEKYYMASKTFMFYEPITIKDKVRTVLIAFGGADPQNYSDRLLEMIRKPEYREYSFIVVLGKAKENVEELLKYNEYPNIEVLYDVPNMPMLMSKCDIAITSRGRTGYELAFLGIPSIAMAQNKREEKHGFVSNENGFSYIGLNPSNEVIEGHLNMYLKSSRETRTKFHEMLLSHDLRNGRKRIMSLINSL
jgi:CMP-N-acetylneuraminic acid synthetase/spore coat polysaccharide biosynthesis predicted glycosyltransferase SpsG